MAQSLSKVYLHIIFSTKHHNPIIDDQIASRLFEYMGGICRTLECHPVQIGGYLDHVHVLCRLSRNVSLSQLLKDLKQHSSKWIKTQGEQYFNFYWQRGYGAFSVKPNELDPLIYYIKNQKAKHTKKTFKSEFIQFLKANKVDYNEEYLWD